MPYYTDEFTEALRGRVIDPRHVTGCAGWEPGTLDKAVTHYSLTLRGTVNPVTFGFTSSKFWNTWLLPKMRSMFPFGTGNTHGFGMCCDGDGSSSRAS